MRWGAMAGGSGRIPTFAPPGRVVSVGAPMVTYPLRARARLRASQSPPPSPQASQSPPPALTRLAKSFQQAADPLVRYKQLLHLASELPPLPPRYQTPAHRVPGCVSQVWVASSVDDQGVITWMADSDSQLTKGLAAVLVQGLSGVQAAEVAALPPSFIADFGFAQALTPSRSNGFLNMFLLMRRKAAEIAARLACGEAVVDAKDAEAGGAPVQNAEAGGAPIQSAPPSDGDADLVTSDVPSTSSRSDIAEEGSPERRRHAEAGSAPRAPHAPGREAGGSRPEAVQAAERALTKELSPQRLSIEWNFAPGGEKLAYLIEVDVAASQLRGLSTLKQRRKVAQIVAAADSRCHLGELSIQTPEDGNEGNYRA